VPLAGVVLATVSAGAGGVEQGPRTHARETETTERRTVPPADRPLLLVLRALGLGDLLTAVPALRGLRESFPGHRIVLAAPQGLAPLAELSGAVDAVVDAAPLAPLDTHLSGADVAVNLHGRGPQSHRLLLDAWPRRLIAFAHPGVPQSRDGPDWRADEHEVVRWCRLVAESGVPASPRRLDMRPPPLDAVDAASRAASEAARGATLIHPGAASAARRWPPERFAAVARAQREKGRAVVVTGSAAEAGLARRVASEAELPERTVLAGRTDLLGLAAVVAAAGRVVCGDTGVAHLATALGTPSVVLFGPTSPRHWGPPPDRGQHDVLWKERVGDPHGDEPDPGLLEIGVDEALAALDRLREGEGHADREGDEPDPRHPLSGPGVASVTGPTPAARTHAAAAR
jgi:ADP-heptose:LPS heptosyltransferase